MKHAARKINASKNNKIKESASYHMFSGVTNLVFLLFSISTVLPMILTIIVSFTDERAIMRNGYSFFPEKWSTMAYQLVMDQDWVFRAYGVTIFVTVAGTFLCVVFSSLCAYAIAQPTLKYRNVLALFLFIPVVFNAGVVPWYLIVTRTLHLKNTIFALIFPIIVQPFWVFLLRNYFKTIPPALTEAAEIDGAGKVYTFFKIVLPISKPIVATVALFAALMYWNDYVTALWLVDKQELWPLQYMLYKINSLITFLTKGGATSLGGINTVVPNESFIMVVFVVAMGPIVLVYPFVQKYFVKGIVVGAVKG